MRKDASASTFAIHSLSLFFSYLLFFSFIFSLSSNIGNLIFFLDFQNTSLLKLKSANALVYGVG